MIETKGNPTERNQVGASKNWTFMAMICLVLYKREPGWVDPEVWTFVKENEDSIDNPTDMGPHVEPLKLTKCKRGMHATIAFNVTNHD